MVAPDTHNLTFTANASLSPFTFLFAHYVLLISFHRLSVSIVLPFLFSPLFAHKNAPVCIFLFFLFLALLKHKLIAWWSITRPVSRFASVWQQRPPHRRLADYQQDNKLVKQRYVGSQSRYCFLRVVFNLCRQEQEED